ncbi:universal stress protein [Streptomyces sp. NPDC102384]|uniref:universal stress protein n=1 Tax=Streptomyces sp. NPDC102384 TaxID=3366166 RepID=UPI00381DC8C4
MVRGVVVCVDGPACSDVASQWAAREARLRALPLRVVHVAPLGDAVSWPAAIGERAELLVVGTPEGGGPAARGIAARCPAPVVLVPTSSATPEARRWSGKVTLCLDAHDPADGALDFALRTARLRGVPLHVLHAWSYPKCPVAALPFAVPEKDRATWEDQEVQRLSDTLRPWREKYPEVRVLPDVFHCRVAADALLRAAESAELLVVGRRRAGRLGPNAEAALGSGLCAVAVVPA